MKRRQPRRHKTKVRKHTRLYKTGRKGEVKRHYRTTRPPRRVLNRYKGKTYAQLRKRYHIHPLRDDDGDKKRNYEDCRPWDAKKQDTTDIDLDRYIDLTLKLSPIEDDIARLQEELKELQEEEEEVENWKNKHQEVLDRKPRKRVLDQEEAQEQTAISRGFNEFGDWDKQQIARYELERPHKRSEAYRIVKGRAERFEQERADRLKDIQSRQNEIGKQLKKAIRKKESIEDELSEAAHTSPFITEVD